MQDAGGDEKTTWGGRHMATDVLGKASVGLAPTLSLPRLVKTHRPARPRCPPPQYAGHVPNLVLQEVHVAVKQGVGRGEDAHGLHARTALQLAFHRHVGEAGQAEEGPLPEVAETGQMHSVAQDLSDTFRFALPCPLSCSLQEEK